MGFNPCKVEQPIRGWSYMKKKHKNINSIQKICLKRTYSQKISVNSRLKATKILGQRKAYYRTRIPESSCARKEPVDIDMYER